MSLHCFHFDRMKIPMKTTLEPASNGGGEGWHDWIKIKTGRSQLTFKLNKGFVIQNCFQSPGRT